MSSVVRFPFFYLLLGFLGLGTPMAFAQAAGAEQVTISSSTRRFAVRSSSTVDNTVLVTWLEDVTTRIEKRMGATIPFDGMTPMLVILDDRDPFAPPRVTPFQAFRQGSLRQQLVVVQPARIDQEILLDQVTRLLLDRYALGLQAPEARAARPASVPAWFVAGIAQDLFPDTRARNRKHVHAAWQEGQVPAPQQLLEHHFLPAKASLTKQICGAFVNMLQDLDGFEESLPDFFRIWAKGEELTAKQLVQWLPELEKAEDLDRFWDLYLFRSPRIHSHIVTPLYENTHRLREALLLTWEDGLPGDEEAADFQSRPLAPADLMEHLEAPWLPAAVFRTGYRIHYLTLGQPPEFREVVADYAQYFSALRAYPDLPIAERRDERRKLLRLLNKAEKGLAKYEERLTGLRALMDHVEERRTPAEASATTDSENPDWTRPDARNTSPYEAWLDSVESRNSDTP